MEQKILEREMSDTNKAINEHYEEFWKRNSHVRVYPTEMVVRIFLANYPNLQMKKPKEGQKVLDLACGDGRNTAFLCEQGYDVYGTEITQGIIDATGERLKQLGLKADLRVGRNSKLPFEDGFFDYILACHACYYCDEGESFMDNMKEYSRVLKKGGTLIASMADMKSFIFSNATACDDGSFIINDDYYGNRNGYRLQAFTSNDDIKNSLDGLFENFSFGHANNDYFGINEQLFWTVCNKK